MLFKNTCSNELLNLLEILQKDTLFKDYLLVGGTALSLQLGHRKSIDIDLFTLYKQDNNIIKNKIDLLFKNNEVINNSENIFQVLINGIKTDFVSATGKLMEKPIIENNFKICHFKDIAGMKLDVINSETGRKKAKDYVDIAYLIDALTLPVMFDIYKYKYNKTNILNVKKDLLDVRYINPYTWKDVIMVKNNIMASDVPKYIQSAVENYNKLYNNKKKIFNIFKSINRLNITHDKYDTSYKELKETTGDVTKITELETYDEQTKKLTYKNQKGKYVYVLQRNNGIHYDIWHFNRNFDKNQAEIFLQEWNQKHKKNHDHSNKEKTERFETRSGDFL